MDLTQINEILDRGYVIGILLAIAFLLTFIAFREKPQKSRK